MRRLRRMVMVMLVAVVVAIQMVIPATAKDLTSEQIQISNSRRGVDDENFAVPDNNDELDDADQQSEPGVLGCWAYPNLENAPQVEIAAVYTAWNENLPVGMKATRTNILGTERKVMLGSYVDCVVAIDLPDGVEFSNLQVFLTTNAAADQLRARVALCDSNSGFENIVSCNDAVADLQLDDDILVLTDVAPCESETNHYHQWRLISWPYLQTDVAGSKIGNLGFTQEASKLTTVCTKIICANFDLNDCQHFEVIFRLYSMSEEEWEEYQEYMTPCSDPDLESRSNKGDLDKGDLLDPGPSVSDFPEK